MSRIELIQADITRQAVDAIVNAANSELSNGGGVARAVERAAGPAYAAECRAAAHVPTGSALPTTGGELLAKHVINAVGPVWNGGNNDETELLEAAYRSALAVAADLRCESLAFPSISTGTYGFPVDRAAAVALVTVNNTLASGLTTLRLVRFCLFSPQDLDAYRWAAVQAAIDVEASG